MKTTCCCFKDQEDNWCVFGSECDELLILVTNFGSLLQYQEQETEKRSIMQEENQVAKEVPSAHDFELKDVEKQMEAIVNPDGSKMEDHGPYFGVRHYQVLLYFLLTFIAYGIRVNLSVGIVAMTTPASENPDIPYYPNWTDKSIMLSSFFWGYIILQIPAGQLAKHFGPKWFLTGSMAICACFSLLLPTMAATFGSIGVMASRALQGLCQGFIFPCLHDMLSRWVPLSERSRLGTFVYAGGPLGTVVSMLATGLIAASWKGWPLVFHLYGALGILWAIGMAVLGADSPEQAVNITAAERHYIEVGTGTEAATATEILEHRKYTPWKAIFLSPPVWAVLVAHCGQNWGFWTLITEIPSYMSSIMNFNIKSNSYLSALPYFILWVLSFVFSAIADCCINRRFASIGTTRKIFNTIGLVVPAVALVFLSYMNAEHRQMAIVLLVIAVGTNSAVYCGFNVNHMDIAPKQSGTLMGITNCISNIFSLLAPLMVQAVVTDETQASQWQIVFCVAATIYTLSAVVFIIFGTGVVQKWDQPPPPPPSPPGSN